MLAVSIQSPAWADVEKGKNYDRTYLGLTNGNPTYQFTTVPERIIDHYDQSNNPVYANYKLTQNATKVILETMNAGSFVFDKNSCTYSMYENGPVSGNGQIKNISYLVKGKLSSNSNWVDVSSVNNAACSVMVSSNETQVVLIGSKVNGAGTFQIELKYSPGKGIKETLRAYNNNPTWNNHNIGFVESFEVPQVIKFGGLQYDLSQYNNTVLDRNWITNNKAKLIQLTNNLNYDFGIGFANLNDVKITWINNKAKLSLNYLYPLGIVPYQQWIEVDPTFNSGASNQGRVYAAVGVTNCASATGTTADATLQISLATGVNGCQMVWQEWDISTIPAGVIVTSAYFEWDQTLTNGWTKDCGLYAYATQPSTLTTANKYSQGWGGVGSGTTSLCTSDGANKQLTLNSTGISNLQSNIAGSEGWWGAMFQGVSGVNKAGPYEFTIAGAAETKLNIVYSVPPHKFGLKPMQSDNSTAFGSGWVYQKNATYNNPWVLNSTGYASMTSTTDAANYNYTAKDALDNFVVNKTYNKAITADKYKQGPTNIFPVSLGSGNDYQIKTNFTNYHNLTYWTAPYAKSNGDISFTLRFIKDGLGPSTNQTTRIIARVLDLVNFNYSPSSVLVNGSSKSFTFSNSVMNTTTIQVGNGYKSFRLFVTIVTDNVTSAPTALHSTRISGTQNNLSWTAPSSTHGDAIQSYRIWRDGTVLVNSTGSTATTYSDTGLTSGRNYVYMVCAWNRIGCSPYSSPITVGAPDKVSTLIATATAYNNIDLSWTAPNLHSQTLSGYQINYTTPYGLPVLIIINDTHSATVSYSVSGLNEATAYSFRVSAWTTYWNNATGNIANATTPARFVPANFTIGAFNVDSENPDQVGIRFTRTQHNSTTTWVNITYPKTYDLACDITYQYAMTNHTYHSIVHTSLNADEYMATLQFNNATNDIASIYCWNQDNIPLDNGTFVLSQSSFLLLEQVDNFRNGTYGTHGMIGALDLITLIVVIFSMVGFNRINESVGMFFCLSAVGAVAYFGIITWPGAVFSALAVIVMFIIGSTKKD